MILLIVVYVTNVLPPSLSSLYAVYMVALSGNSILAEDVPFSLGNSCARVAEIVGPFQGKNITVSLFFIDQNHLFNKRKGKIFILFLTLASRSLYIFS